MHIGMNSMAGAGGSRGTAAALPTLTSETAAQINGGR